MNKEAKMLECAYGKKIEAVNNATGQFITTHNKLLNMINLLGMSYTINFTANIPEKAIYVCTCEITDALHDRSVMAVGEASPQNLYNEFDRIHPAYTASIRAFDRAAIQILEIRENLYSYSEISKEMFFGDKKKNDPDKTPDRKSAQNLKPEEQKTEENKNAENKNRPSMPRELGDTILIGSLKGRKYEEVKNSAAMTQFIQVLKENPEMIYGSEIENAQAKFFRKLF